MIRSRLLVRFFYAGTLFALVLSTRASGKGPDPEPLSAVKSPATAPVPVELRTDPTVSPLAVPTIESRPLGKTAEPETSSGTSAAVLPSFARTLLSLGTVIGIVLLVAFVLKRLPHRGTLGAALLGAGRSPSGIVEVLGRFTLSRGVTLVLLRVDRRVVLLSQSGGSGSASVSLLLELDHPDEVASLVAKCNGDTSDAASPRFERALGRADLAASSATRTAAPQRTPSGAPDPSTVQLSQALRARLAAMRAATPPSRKAAA